MKNKSKQKVEIEFEVDTTKYDESNPLIISANDRKKCTKNKNKKAKITEQLLSKKKRKQLEKILQRKNKKLNRTNLINDLKQYQANETEYDCMPSTSIVQTTGKRKLDELLKLYNSINKKDDCENEFQTVKRKFKLRKINFKSNEKNFNRKNPNILKFDSSSSECSDESDEISEEEGEEEDINNCDKTEEKEEIAIPKNDTETKIVSNDTGKDNSETKGNNLNKTSENKQSVYITVDRPENIQNDRLKLPILSEEHNIMEQIMYNPVVIICGETGSGKTTQVPQFLYEAGYAVNNKMIGITEPRRVAAISMAKRVGYELNLTDNEVSYQIRFEGNVTDKTKIKFMTDGILMKEIEKDFILSKYSAIIIDEAHERSLYSDILIGFLSRIVQLRNKQGDPLKLIIMSATLRVEDFTQNSRLFKNPPPVVKIESRQYPVSIHFNKFTNPNYLQEAFKKVCKIHTTLPSGGILVFVTGRKEVLALCRMLKNKFPFKDEKTIEQNSEIKSETESVPDVRKKFDLDQYSIIPDENERIVDDFDLSDNEINDSDNEEELSDIECAVTDEPLYCLPLYSMLPNSEQALVFQNPPDNCRLCVVATNVAETSITIPKIKYVIDTGKVKNKVYDKMTSISTFIIDWTSKASADQRAGRAGRTCPGHCYRLYSSSVFNDQFKQYTDPEILIKPFDDLLLHMKAIGIINVINFPFPTLPNIESLISAEKLLINLDALEEDICIGKKEKRTKVTTMGKLMSYFPINPRYSKILCISNQYDIIPHLLVIISSLSVQEIFLPEQGEVIEKRKREAFFINPYCKILGDLMIFLCVFGAAQHEDLSRNFCKHFGIRYSAIVEIDKLRHQLFNEIQRILKDETITNELIIPDQNQIQMLSKLFLCGFSDHVAKRVPVTCVAEADESGNVRKIERTIRNCYQTNELDDYVFISPNSVLHNETYEYVVYHEIFETSKLYMRNNVPIKAEWLPIYASKHCKFSNPLEEPPPRYDPKADKVKCHRTSTFGRNNWPLPAVEVDYPDCIEKFFYFAYFLFEGHILKWFENQKKFMSIPANIFLRSWGRIQAKVENVIKCFTNNNICTKQSLLDKWKNDKKFLLNEYLAWIHESQRDNIRGCWPPAES